MRIFLFIKFILDYRILFHLCFGNSVFSQNTLVRIKRYNYQPSITCVLYDEAPAGHTLVDELSGNPCSLFSLIDFPATRDGYSVTTKFITSSNLLGSKLSVQPRNLTLFTSQRIDREQICEDALKEESTAGDGILECCTARLRECNLPLTVLMQAKDTRNDTMNENRSSQFLRIHIRLIDINDNAPQFPSAKHHTHISESVKVGTRIPLPLARDADSIDYGVVRYHLKSEEVGTFELVQLSTLGFDALPTEHRTSMFDYVAHTKYPEIASAPNFPGYAHVHSPPTQVYLNLSKSLDWETKKLYKFILVAEDNGVPSLAGQMEIQIQVTDENDNHPTFVNKSFSISVPEDSAKGRRLIQLVAHDPDDGRGGLVSYSLAENSFGLANPNQSNSPFHIDSHTGWLSLNSELDHERTTQYLIRVLAKDEAGHPGFDEATVNVFVLDVNDVAPIISVEPILESIIKNPRERNKSIQKNTANLHVAESATIKQVTDGKYTPLLHDRNILLALVSVRDPDSASGGQFQCGLKESKLANKAELLGFVGQDGREYYRVKATDDQHQEPLSMSAGTFRLNAISKNQFELIAVGGFDHEREKMEQVLIVCGDFGEPSLSSTFTVNVHVEDLNDNAPKFTQNHYQLTLEENKPIDTIVGKISATDMDSGRNAEIEYFLDATGSEFFRVDPIEGTLYTRVMFDREVRQKYRFEIFAKDKGSPNALTGSATFELSVLDVNDNTPEFVGLDYENCYKFRIAENEPAVTHVGILLGSDIDEADNARLRFRLITSTSQFKLDTSTGELTTAQSLDRERQAEYELSVILSDSGRPPRSATAKINIYVVDVNDNDPIIVFPANGRGNVTVSFREPSGEVVARIEARDPDEGHNALLHYGLVSGNRNNVFRMGGTSAELIIDRNLDESDLGMYALDILVQDAGVPPRSTQVQMIVHVTDSPPRMYSHRFSAHKLPQSELSLVNPKAGFNRHPESAQNGKNTRIIDSVQNEGGIVSAGAILVAIVALSCAIILVLLGLAVYLCGRRGFRFALNSRRRQLRAVDRNGWLSVQTGAVDKDRQMMESPMQMKQASSISNLYSDQILLDHATGTILRCPVAHHSPSVASATDPDDKRCKTKSSKLTHDGYTTFIQTRERKANLCRYDNFTVPRLCLQTDYPTINNTLAMDRKIAPAKYAKSSTIEPVRSNYSIKMEKLNESRQTGSPISDGSAITNEYLRIGNCAKILRNVRSCESLLTLKETDDSFDQRKIANCRNSPYQIPQADQSSELLKGSVDIQDTKRPVSAMLSTFLPGQPTPSQCLSHKRLQKSIQNQTGCDHTCLIPAHSEHCPREKNTECPVPTAQGFVQFRQPSCCESNFAVSNNRFCGFRDGNLIDLIDSGTNSNSSQTCSCHVGDTCDRTPQRTRWGSGEQAEFV